MYFGKRKRHKLWRAKMIKADLICVKYNRTPLNWLGDSCRGVLSSTLVCVRYVLLNPGTRPDTFPIGAIK